jgi:hypothetical protein
MITIWDRNTSSSSSSTTVANITTDKSTNNNNNPNNTNNNNNTNTNTNTNTNGAASSSSSSSSSNGDSDETFLGMMKIRPPRINGKIHDNWFRLLPRQWKEKVRGDIRIQLMYQTVEAKSLSAADFELLKVVGKGSFGKVLQVRKKDTGEFGFFSFFCSFISVMIYYIN